MRWPGMAAGQDPLPRRRCGRRPGRRRRLARRRRLRRAPDRRRRDGRVPVIAEGERTRAGRRRPRRLRVGDRIALVAPASPVRAEDLDRGADELRALGFEPVPDSACARPPRLRRRPAAGAGGGAGRRLAGPVDPRRDRRARRLRFAAAAAAARSALDRRRSQGLRRLQRPDVAPRLAARARHGGVPWSDGRGPPGARRRRLRSRVAAGRGGRAGADGHAGTGRARGVPPR